MAVVDSVPIVRPQFPNQVAEVRGNVTGISHDTDVLHGVGWI